MSKVIKIGTLNVPKKHCKGLLVEFAGKDVEYEVPTMQPAIGKAFTICLVKLGTEMHQVPLKWIKNHLDDLRKGLNKNKIYEHTSGFRIINSGMGVGVKTGENDPAWACSMRGLDAFLEYTKTQAKDYTEIKKEVK